MAGSLAEDEYCMVPCSRGQVTGVVEVGVASPPNSSFCLSLLLSLCISLEVIFHQIHLGLLASCDIVAKMIKILVIWNKNYCCRIHKSDQERLLNSYQHIYDNV